MPAARINRRRDILEYPSEELANKSPADPKNLVTLPPHEQVLSSNSKDLIPHSRAKKEVEEHLENPLTSL